MSQIKGVYNSTPPTVRDGQNEDIQLDVNGNLKTTSADKDANGNLPTTLGEIIAGERNPSSATNNYMVAVPECNITIVDLATDADVVVSDVPSLVFMVFVDTVMSAHAALIKDATTTLITVPALSVAGYQIPGWGGKFATNITVESNDAATGKLAIFWRAL